MCTITAEGERLIARMAPKEQMTAVLGDADDDPPIPLMLVTGEGDPFVVPDGPAKGMRGYFTRGGDGAVAGGHGMWGVTLGPLTGQLLAERIVTGRTPELLHPLDPLR